MPREGVRRRAGAAALVHVRSVVDRPLSVWLAGHEDEPRPRLRILHGQRTARSEHSNLPALGSKPVGAEAGLALEHVDEAVGAGLGGDAGMSAFGQLDVQDQPRSPELDGRALADEHPYGRAAVMADGHLARLHHPRERLDTLVLAREVDPEQEAAHLGGLAFAALVIADAFRVQDAAAGAYEQERSLVQPRSLEVSDGTGAVARARRPRDRVPQVVESAVRVRGVLALLVRIDLEVSLVDEDVRVHERVRDVPRRQGFEDLVAHHRADVSVLDEDDFTLRCVDLSGHGLCLLLVWARTQEPRRRKRR